MKMSSFPLEIENCDNRFLAWESTSVKTWETLWLRGRTESVTGNYLQRRQQQTELRSNDIVLIQELDNQRIFYKALLLSRKHNSNGLRKAIKKS